MLQDKGETLAYVIGLAIGDGNLSNPNGRAVRLRISCDTKYPILIKKIICAVQKVMPHNKVSTIKRKSNCCDISCYSNKWEELLGWKALGGSKFKQNVSIPLWIKNNNKYLKSCLRGLIQTDGSIYIDRVYKMINFTTIIPILAKDFLDAITQLNYSAKIYKIKNLNKYKYIVRISKNTERFIKELNIFKE